MNAKGYMAVRMVKGWISEELTLIRGEEVAVDPIEKFLCERELAELLIKSGYAEPIVDIKPFNAEE